MTLRTLFVIAALPAGAAIFPAQLGEFARGKVTALQAPDKELYQEYGFQEAEQADYTGPAGKFTIAGWKLHDSTGAMALWQLRRPAAAKPASQAELAASTPNGLVVAYGNFVFEYVGRAPAKGELDTLLVQLKGVERSALPTLPGHLPADGLIPNSERYILGPVSLARFAGTIPPSVAAFHLAAEGQLGRYRAEGGEFTAVVFDYPVPNMARDQQTAFLGLPGTLAKRAGSMVAVVLPPANPDAAERVLAKVVYQPVLTRQDVSGGAVQGMANIVLTGFLMAGVLMGASLLAGIWLGGFKAILRRFGWVRPEEGLTVLRINGK